MKKQILAVALILLISLISFLCQKPADSPRADRSTVTVLYPWDERVLGPLMDVGAKFLVFLPLFTTDEIGHIQGKLAERWNHSADYRSWKFDIRKDVKWHDGSKVTAHDVKFTLELISRPDILYDDAWESSARSRI
jgi:peptide/nickel transport system substrate-binding protein